MEPEELGETADKATKSERDEKSMWYVPWSVTSFDELDGVEAAQTKAEEMELVTRQFSQISENILWSTEDEVPDKTKALDSLVKELGTRMKQVGVEKKTFLDSIKGLFAVADTLPDSEPESSSLARSDVGFQVIKSQDGTWRWLATYSNSFEDKDDEVITAKSHIRFENLVDAGQYQMPELWLHHEKGWKWGVADFVATDLVSDGVVFAIAGGTVDKGCEWLAEDISKMDKPFTVSHGMPRANLKYSPENSRLIEEHQTVEISPLIEGMESNDLTGFYIDINKEKSMAVSNEKRDLYAKLVDLDGLLGMEQSNKSLSADAVEADRLHKEAGDNEADESPDLLKAIGDIADILKSLKTDQDSIAGATEKGFGSLETKMTAFEERLASLEKVSGETQSLTPAASLVGAIKSAVGDDATKLDGRSALAKKGPAENEDKGVAVGGTGIGLIESLKAGSRGNHFAMDHSTQINDILGVQVPASAQGEEA